MLQQDYGVFTRAAPHVGVEVAEQCFSLAVPYPPKVFGNLLEMFELRGEVGCYRKVAPRWGVCVANLKFHVVACKYTI